MEKKLTYRQCHVQDNSDVELKDVKIYCNANQFPELSFSGPHSKPRCSEKLHLQSYLEMLYIPSSM